LSEETPCWKLARGFRCVKVLGEGTLPHVQLCRTESSAGRAAVASIEGAPYSEKNCSGLDFEILGDPQDSVILRT